MFTSRIVLAVLWAMSLVAAAHVGASAQLWQDYTPGSEVRFVQIGTRNGMPEGLFTARINGEWKGVQIRPEPGGIVPLDSRPTSK
jgi:hypothetical protein